MLAGSKEGTPYEIVAAQALLARWAGIPSRIGYGFDGGEVTDNKLEVRPKNGASFPEVYFSKYGWLPVIGTPTKAKPTVGSEPANPRQDALAVPALAGSPGWRLSRGRCGTASARLDQITRAD